MPGYHTGPAAYLGYTLGARHSHLDNGGYSIDQKGMIPDNYPEPEEVVDNIITEEYLRQILSSIVICFFARGVYNKDIINKTLKTTGYNLDIKNIESKGKEIYDLKYKFKFREGYNFDDIKMPERIYNAPDPTGKITKEYIEKGLKHAFSIIKP